MSQKRSLLTNGLALTLRHWPALVWTYVFNLGLALLFAIPLHNQLSAITAQSLASQSLGSGFDIGTLVSVLTELGKGPGPAINFYAVWVYLPLYFLLVPGTLFCYATDTPAKLSTLLQTGLLYFWRFVRVTLISFVVFLLILGPLMAFHAHYANSLDAALPGKSVFLHKIFSLVLIGLVAAVLRVFFDLVEVYTIQLGLQSDRHVRRAIKPAFRALRHNFLRAWLTFVLLTFIGLSAVIITARISMHSLAQPHVWPMFLLAQIGLFLMMLTRFWQRGAETILALDNPIPEPVILVEPLPVAPIVEEIIVVESIPTDPFATEIVNADPHSPEGPTDPAA